MLPSYARMPLMYANRKIHKMRIAYRPIVSKINTQFYNMSKWLVGRFATLKNFDRFSVKNSIQFADKLKNIELADDEILVSFDIESYFTSVPVVGALDFLRVWLDRQSLDHIEADALFELTETCANNSYFQFRDRFYRQMEGMAMDDCLSPFLCNLFVNDLEEKLAKDDIFPRIWWRYVDDVFAVVKRDQLDEVLAHINGISDNINFTAELENNGKLNFLDLTVERNADGGVVFDVFRKPTSTERYITIESNHHQSQKYAAFNSMAHRLCNLPLNDEKFEAERQRIILIAAKNGYGHESIDRLINKHRKVAELRSVTSLCSQSDKKRISMTFCPKYHQALSKFFQK